MSSEPTDRDRRIWKLVRRLDNMNLRYAYPTAMVEAMNDEELTSLENYLDGESQRRYRSR